MGNNMKYKLVQGNEACVGPDIVVDLFDQRRHGLPFRPASVDIEAHADGVKPCTDNGQATRIVQARP